MTSRLSLLFASTAVTVALGLPALAAMQTQGDPEGQCDGVCATLFGGDDLSASVIGVSGGDDDDDDFGGWVRRGRDGDDAEDCEVDDDYDHDDDRGAGACALGDPAPAGIVAPPANGLFGDGAPPVALTK